jgi:hypothetical protein
MSKEKDNTQGDNTDEEWLRDNAPDTQLVKALKREIGDLKKQAQKQQTVMDLIRVALTESFDNLPPIEIPRFRQVKQDSSREEIPILHISDTQIGKVTATYNSEVAEQRLMLLANKVLEVINIRRSYSKIDELRLYLGGDIGEGEDIFPGQGFQIDQSVFDQACRTAPRILAQLILLLFAGTKDLPGVSRIKVKTVPGNHGRNGRFGGNSHPRTNWDNVIYVILETMLLGYEGNRRQEFEDRLSFDISEDFFIVDRVWDWGNLIVHGDQITGGFAGFPFYGTAKKAWGWIDSIPQQWDNLFFGHFHTPMSGVLNHRTFYCNGTTESDNAYAQAQMAAAGWPCQRLCFMSKKHGVVTDGLIYLTDDRKPSLVRGR